MSYFPRRLLGFLGLLCLLLPALALADPPARVGRLAHIENGVDFRVDRDSQGEPATVNWPISSGAALDTDRRGRAEVWIGSTAYRLAGDSQLEFAVVDDQQVRVQLSQGTLAISIMDRDQASDLTVETPEGRIRFDAPGRYRIDVRADHSELTVQAGQGSVEDRGRSMPVMAGQKASLFGGGSVRLELDNDQDTFDRWVAERENSTMASASRRYVSPQMTGYADLDAYGDWRPATEYGSVWYPRRVADDWAPYRFGRWAWVAPWGWTWIDQAPWGFAPFHYGRWVMIGGRWGWVPGQLVARPVYAPALVAWIGNPGWSVSFSFGSAPAVGWFPLAPREVYVPAYRYSADYLRQINLTHVRDHRMIDQAVRGGARENFAYRGQTQAVTVVPANLLREGGQITRQTISRHDRRDLERAPLATRAPNTDWAPSLNADRRPRDEDRPVQRPESRYRGSAMPESRQAYPSPGMDRPNEFRREAPSRDLPNREFQSREIQGRDMPSRDLPRREAAPEVRRESVRPERELRPSMPATPPQEIRAPLRSPEVAPAPAPAMRSESFAPAPRREMREERQSAPSMPPPEREIRREAPRVERFAPREMEAPVVRQREMPMPAPAPAPVIRSAPPQPAPQMAPPQVQREAPREAPRAREPDNSRHQERKDGRNDERGDRGPR